jgi:UDP-N-acetylglucosamine acyltransferase
MFDDYEKTRYPGNIIHPTAIIDSSCIMGTENFIGPHTVIGQGVRIGNRNRIEGFASIGSPAEHQRYFIPDDAERPTIIGHDCVIREFTTINAPTTGETRMGNGCVMLRGSHLSHDSVLGDKVNLSCGVLLGGHSHVMSWATLGLGAITHQFSVIGAAAFLGMGTIVTKKSVIRPGEKYVGNPARHIGHNAIGVEKACSAGFNMADADAEFWRLKETKS